MTYARRNAWLLGIAALICEFLEEDTVLTVLPVSELDPAPTELTLLPSEQ